MMDVVTVKTVTEMEKAYQYYNCIGKSFEARAPTSKNIKKNVTVKVQVLFALVCFILQQYAPIFTTLINTRHNTICIL